MKKTQKIRIIVLLVATGLFIVAAYYVSQEGGRYEPDVSDGGEKATTTEEDTATSTEQGTTTDLQTVAKETLERETEEYTIKADYPVGDSWPGASVVRETIQQDADNFASRAQENQQAQPSGNPYEKITKFETYEYNDQYSYVVETYVYMGGATGSSVVTVFVFDENGTRLDLSDFIGEEKSEQDAFLSRVKKQLQSQVDELSLFPDAIVDLTFRDIEKSFYPDRGGFNFVFSQYMIAPGASGIVRTTIPRTMETGV